MGVHGLLLEQLSSSSCSDSRTALPYCVLDKHVFMEKHTPSSELCVFIKSLSQFQAPHRQRRNFHILSGCHDFGSVSSVLLSCCLIQLESILVYSANHINADWGPFLLVPKAALIAQLHSWVCSGSKQYLPG